MLFLIKLNKIFWTKTVLTTIYLYIKTFYININYKFLYKLKFDHNLKSNLKHIKIWKLLTYNLINKSKKLNFWTKFIILIKYKISNLYKLLNVTNDKTFLLRDVQILKNVFLNEIQKTSNNFLIDEINAFRLINKRKKHKILSLCDAQKNLNRIFLNIVVNKNEKYYVKIIKCNKWKFIK